jgi:dihydroorotase
VDLLCSGPARVFDVRSKGRIALGYDADLTLVDLDLTRDVDERAMRSRCGWTPFAGMRLRGWPRMCVVNGVLAMRDDEVVAPANGRAVRFWGVPLPSPAG